MFSSAIIPGMARAGGSSPASGSSPAPSAVGPRHDLYVGTVDLSLQTVNPLQYTLVDEYYVLGNVYSFLVNYDGDWHEEPDLAVSWSELSANPTVYEFHLAHNAYFVDPRGCTYENDHLTACPTKTQVKASDVKFTYDYVKKNRNQTSYFVTLVESIDYVTVIDDYTVRIAFHGPYPPAMATFTAVPILPQYIWSPGGVDVKVDWTNALPIGSGPYMVRASGTSFAMVTPPPLIFDRNPYWHGEEVQGRRVFTDTIYYESYTTSAAMAVDLTLGKLDFALGPSPQDYTTYLSNKPGVYRQALYDGFEAEQAINVLPDDLRQYFADTTNRPVNLGSTNPLLLDQTVRTAIHMATDRQQMIDKALLGLGMPGDTLMPASVPAHYDMPPFSTDDKNGDGSPYDFPPFASLAMEEFPDGPAALPIARQMLVDAGWQYACSTGAPQTGVESPLCKKDTATGKMVDALTFRFSTFNTEPWWETAARVVIENAAAVGIQLNLELLNGSQMYNLWYRLDYDIWLWDWVWTPVTDISTFMIVQTCKGIATLDNDNGFCLRDSAGHWVFDDLYNQTLTETDPGSRKALSDQMNQIIYGYASYNIPFYKADTYAYNEVRWTHWPADFNQQRAFVPDDGNTPLLGQLLWPVSEKPPQFSLSNFEGVVGQPVQFSVAAVDPQGGPLKYRWDFDTSLEAGGSGLNADGIPYNDDQGGNTATPTWTYGTAGTYGISLRVSQDGGDNFFTVQRAQVKIYAAAPGAPKITGMSFSPSDPTTASGDAVTLAASVVDPAGLEITQYTWNWGDGSANTVTALPTASHQYTTASTYTVELTVKNSADASSSSSKIVPVVNNVAPVVAPLESTAVIVDANNSFVAFASDANARDVLSYAWTFGDGATMTGNPVYHIYTTQNQQYTLTVTVSDGHGHSTSSSAGINVVADRNTAPKINSFTASPTSAYTTLPITFTASVTDDQGNNLTWAWDFNGDGVAETTYETPLSAPGVAQVRSETYLVTSTGSNIHAKLTVTDKPLTGNPKSVSTTVTISVQANAPPTLTDITVSPTSGSPGDTFSFSSVSDDTDGDRLAYAWEFGDGSSETGQTTYFGGLLSTTHVYATGGDFVAILSVDDGKGGEARTSVIVTVTTGPDTTPPVTTYSISGTAGADGWYRSSVLVALTANDASGVASTFYRVDGGGWTEYSVPFPVSGEGTHTIEYNSTDTVGNGEATHTASVKIDTVAPTTTTSYTGTLSGSWYTSAVTVTLAATDATSGVAAVSYRLDAALWTEYTAPFSISAEGTHALEYNATDVAGNIETTQTDTLNIDVTGPTTTATLTGTMGANGWYTSTVSVSLSATDAGSGAGPIRYRVDGDAWATYVAPFSIDTEGLHTVDYNATDALGNVEAVKTTTVEIDTVAPSTAVSLGGTLSGAWYTSAVTVTLTATDATSGVASTSYRLDGGAWQTYSAAVSVATDGSHTLEYNSTDTAGNVEATRSESFGVDLTGPTTTMSVAGTSGSGGWYTSAVTVTLTSADSGSGAGPIRYRVDGGSWATYSSPFSIAQEGTHTVEYNATDAVGNAEAVKTSSVNIDTVAPTVTLTTAGTSGSADWYRSVVSVTVTGTDATSGVATREYRIDGGAWQTYTGAFDVPEGTHTVDVRATDVAGHVSTVQSATLKIDATAPTLGGLTPTGTVHTASVTLYWTGADAGSGIAEYTVAVDGATATSTGTTNSTTLTLADGTHTITVTATDAAGNTISTDLSLTVSTAVTPSGGPDTGTIIGIVVVAAAAVLGASWYVMRRRKAGPPSEPPLPPPEP